MVQTKVRSPEARKYQNFNVAGDINDKGSRSWEEEVNRKSHLPLSHIFMPSSLTRSQQCPNFELHCGAAEKQQQQMFICLLPGLLNWCKVGNSNLRKREFLK